MSMLSHFFDFKPEVLALDEKAMELCQPYFRHMEEIRDYNQLKMLKAFADTQMSSTDMLGTTGYGLWDTGRAKLEQIFAEVMGAEASPRPQPVPERHAYAAKPWRCLVCCGQGIPCWPPPAVPTIRWRVSLVWMARARAPVP